MNLTAEEVKLLFVLSVCHFTEHPLNVRMNAWINMFGAESKCLKCTLVKNIFKLMLKLYLD